MVSSRLEGHLCAQVCAVDSMNIYILNMNMVIKKKKKEKDLIWLAEFQREGVMLSQDSVITRNWNAIYL